MNQAPGNPLDRHALERWQQSPRGRQLLEREQAEMARLLPNLFGRHLLQVGSWAHQGELLAAGEMLHRAVLGTVAGADGQARVEPERLPLPAQSVDALVLAHVLDFSTSPQAVLREANRVLTERGRLIVMAFNPLSVWGVRQVLGLRDRSFPATANFIRARRLCDWLELLDFQVTEQKSLSQAGAYLLFAKKRVIPLLLMRSSSRSRVRPLIGPVALPGAHRTPSGDGEGGAA